MLLGLSFLFSSIWCYAWFLHLSPNLEMFSMILLKILSVPLTWVSAPSSMPVIQSFDLWMMTYISCLSHIPCLFGIDPLFYLQVLIFHLLLDVFYLQFFSLSLLVRLLGFQSCLHFCSDHLQCFYVLTEFHS